MIIWGIGSKWSLNEVLDVFEMVITIFWNQLE